MVSFLNLIAGLALALGLSLSSPLACADSPLKGPMKSMGGGFFALQQGINDVSQYPALEGTVQGMIADAKTAQTMIPAMALGKPLETEAYNAQMSALITTLSQLETALKAKDSAQALSLLKQVNTQKIQGHTRFKPKQD